MFRAGRELIDVEGRREREKEIKGEKNGTNERLVNVIRVTSRN